MATEKVLNTVIQLRNGTAEEWASSMLILRQAEIGIENDTGLFKIGNGKDLFKDLKYANDIKGQISKSEHRYLDVEKAEGDTDQQAIDKAIAAYTNFGNARNGDVCIVRKVISEGHWEYTAYAYSNDVGGWIAMDGNYNAENVYFDKDLITTSAVGNITLTNGQATISTQGKNLKQVFDTIFVKEQNPKTTQPSASITLTGAGAKEVGTSVTPQYSVTFNAGSYTYGPATGVTASSYSITDTNGDTASTASGTLSGFTVGDSTNYSVSATVSYGDGAVPVTNVGNQYPAGKIVAGSKSATSSKITGYRNTFYGSVTSKEGDITSSIVRGLAGKKNSAVSAGNTFKAAEAVGAMRVIIALPSPRTCTSIKDENGLNAEALSAFTKITVAVEGANSYTATNYNVYYKDNASANNKANNWVVTVG